MLNEPSFQNFAKNVTEVGSTAVWRVSTAKHGNGVSELRDNDPSTYWQSDGAQPHTVAAVFPRLTAVTHVALLLDFDADDSYTPRRFTVRAGTHAGDIADIVSMEMHNPNGWIVVPLVGDATDVFPKLYVSTVVEGQAQSPIADMIGVETMGRPCDLVHSFTTATAATAEPPKKGAPHPLLVTLVHFRVTENHQNGRDCHLRGVKIFGPQWGANYTGDDHESFMRFR